MEPGYSQLQSRELVELKQSRVSSPRSAHIGGVHLYYSSGAKDGQFPLWYWVCPKNDAYLYRERHLVECFFNKIKYYRRIFSRFDKLDSRYLGFLSFAGALIWLR